jgi:alkylhydroperoxidase family enzyme
MFMWILPAANERSRDHEEPTDRSPYLAPIEKPKGLMLKLLYWFMRRQFGKVPGWLTVFSARMPLTFTNWMGKVYKLNNKLKLPSDTVALVRARVDAINICTWCMDAGRWYATNKAPHYLPKLDALDEYQTSPLFSDKERAALDFATELTEQKHVSGETRAALSRHYSEREICEIVWLVSSNHLFNINNLALGIGSDGLCETRSRGQSAATRASRMVAAGARPILLATGARVSSRRTHAARLALRKRSSPR